MPKIFPPLSAQKKEHENNAPKERMVQKIIPAHTTHVVALHEDVHEKDARSMYRHAYLLEEGAHLSCDISIGLKEEGCTVDTRVLLVLKKGASAEVRLFTKTSVHFKEIHEYIQALALDAYGSINCIPELDIEEADGQANHGASLRMVDAREQTYLRARGCTKERANEIIAEGFLNAR